MKFATAIGVACYCLFIAACSTFGQNWTNISTIGGENNLIASSADGNKLVAVDQYGGRVYTSTNGGTTWFSNYFTTVSGWGGVASSADGSKLVAVGGFSGGAYTSTNGGVTWISNIIQNCTGVASSADGDKLVATAVVSIIYTSTNHGVTWETKQTPPPFYWASVASSADGNKLVAGTYNGPIYTSTDSGATWISNNVPVLTGGYWYHVASSADGNKLLAGEDQFYRIYTSTNAGATWISNNVPPSGDPVTSSADGSTLMAYKYTSTNGGASWILNSVPSFTSVACSADGSALFGVQYRGKVYVSKSAPTPSLNVARSGDNVLISWIVPSQNFTLQQNFDLTTTNWLDVTNVPTLNLTNLQNEVALPLSPTDNQFFRLKSP